jgi:hypothetical protein
VTRLPLIADRLRLAVEIWLHRYGPWWLVLAIGFGVLLSVAGLVTPRLNAELAAKQMILKDLQVRAASSQQPSNPAALPAATSALHYQTFRETLANDEEVLSSIKAILDAAVSHNLVSTRAEYVRAADANAQAETLQFTVPVRGHYSDVRGWVEEILATQPYVAVNELGFKREDIGVNEIEARVRLTIWHRPAGPSQHAGNNSMGEVDP